jgi:hypothetical protein
MMTKAEQNRQFHQWLQLYINGQLDDVKTAWMKQYAAEHPEAATEVEIERALKNTLINELPDYQFDHGLNRLMSRIQAEENLFKSTTPSRRNNVVKRCIDSLSSLFMNPKWAVAVMTLLLLQTGAITTLLLSRDGTTLPEPYQWRSVKEPSQIQGPVLEITFKSNSTEADIRLLLIKIRGTLLGGPGQLGKYIVKVPDQSITEAQNIVMNSQIIESVQILPELPLDR